MSEPWWQRYLEGTAEQDVGRSAPEFVGWIGVTPAGWDPSGEVWFDWEPPDITRTPGGWVQGGFQAVVLDMVQTFALFTKLRDGDIPMTLEMKVSYLDAAFPSRYRIVGRALRVGRTAAHTDGRIETPDGTVIATSTATQVIKRAAG